MLENYFNYFTEVEECYQRSRGAPILLSALDWALIDSWREAGIPVEAVRRGVERAFQKHGRKRRHKFLKVNGLGYCTQEVLRAAAEAQQDAVEGGGVSHPHREEPPPFSTAEIQAYLLQCIGSLEKATQAGGPGEDLCWAVESLRELAKSCAAPLWASGEVDLEGVEKALSAVEEKLAAGLIRSTSADALAHVSDEVDCSIAPFRRTMTAFQIESLKRQFLRRHLLERFAIPRLSLFYLRP